MLSFAVFGQSYARRTTQDQIKYDEEKKHRQNSSGLLHPNNHWSSLWCKSKLWSPTLKNLTTNLYMERAFSLFSFNFSCRMLKLHPHLTIRTSTGRAASLIMEGNRPSNATAAKITVCVKDAIPVWWLTRTLRYIYLQYYTV